MSKYKILISLSIAWVFLTGATVAINGHPKVYSETQTLTKTAPSVSPLVTTTNNGVKMVGGMGYRIAVCATTGNTLSGTGTIDMYVWPISSGSWPGVWMLNPQLVEAVTVTGKRCQMFGDHQVAVGADIYIEPAANTVTVSGGTQVQVLVEMWGAS